MNTDSRHNSGTRRSQAILLASLAIAIVTIPAGPANAAGNSPVGWLDSVSADEDSITVEGWAADRDSTGQASGVHVYVDGRFTTGGPATGNRPDVDKATELGPNHGFEFNFGAADGLHAVCVYAIDKTGDPNRLLGCRDVRVGPPSGNPPVGWLDRVSGGDSLTIAGWAADPDAPDRASGIHVYVNGRFLAGGPASLNRPDVASATGLGADHGFRFDLNTSSGLHNVCIYAIDRTGDSNENLGCRQVRVGADGSGTKARGWLEVATSSTSGVRLKGWALDPDSTNSIGVHVYVNGRFHSGFRADQTRRDVERVFGVGADHGFDEIVDVSSGYKQVCAYAIDRTGDPNALIDCKWLGVNRVNNLPIERVSRFTTYYDCCRNRVTNIRQIARDVNGTVVMPGETFSIDEVVGPRTSAGGYLPAPYLINGQGACCAVGGGVSQFGTTIHNAVFWGGYDVVSHRPHTGWISRYPLGIEATLVYSSIDYKFTNDTSVPLTIRTSSTSTSVTVELWGYQGGWQMSGYHPRGSRSSAISIHDQGGPNAKRVRASVSGSAPGTVRIVRTLTQGGVARSQTWWWRYVS